LHCNVIAISSSASGQKHALPLPQQQRPVHLNQQTLREDDVEAASQKARVGLGGWVEGQRIRTRPATLTGVIEPIHSPTAGTSRSNSRAPRAVGPFSLRHNQSIERGRAFSLGVNHQRIDIDLDNVRRGQHQPTECEHGLRHRVDIGWRRTAKASEQL
jgi:hypothetical protein